MSLEVPLSGAPKLKLKELPVNSEMPFSRALIISVKEDLRLERWAEKFTSSIG